MTTKPKTPAPKPRRGTSTAPAAEAKREPRPRRVMTVGATAPKESRAETLSKLSTDGVLPLAFAADLFARGFAGQDMDLTAMHTRMMGTAKDAAAGDLEMLERMLSGQAQTLNIMFTELARRAALNMGEHMPAVDMYLRLALKAQSQSRATVETLAEMKNPRSVAFIRQANVAQQQQVNNGVPLSPAREKPKSANELLQDERHEQIALDTGAPGKGCTSHSPLEAVGAVNRAED